MDPLSSTCIQYCNHSLWGPPQSIIGFVLYHKNDNYSNKATKVLATCLLNGTTTSDSITNTVSDMSASNGAKLHPTAPIKPYIHRTQEPHIP